MKLCKSGVIAAARIEKPLTKASVRQASRQAAAALQKETALIDRVFDPPSASNAQVPRVQAPFTFLGHRLFGHGQIQPLPEVDLSS